MFNYPFFERQILIISLTIIESRSRNQERFPGMFKFPFLERQILNDLICNRKWDKELNMVRLAERLPEILFYLSSLYSC